MASIARKNLIEDIPRFLVAQAGILFAVGLVTIQTGVQLGFAQSSSQLIEQSQADLWVASNNMEHLDLTLPLPYERVAEARSVEGVEQAEGVIIGGAVCHEEQANKITGVTLVGGTGGLLFAQDSLTQGSFNDLKQPNTFIVDETSLDDLNFQKVGEQATVNSAPAKLVGLTSGTQSIVFGNLMFTSLESANYYRSYRSNALSSISLSRELTATDPVSFVLIRAIGEENLEALQQRLEAELPEVRAYTRAEMAQQTQAYWQKRSGIGYILGLGAVVGTIVGAVVVGQILYASVSDHIKEFGTLKAMGASDWYIYRVIMEQGLWMAILGYLPGMALCLGVAAWTSATQGILILITPASAIAVLGITVVMCLSSAIFAIQKVTRVDPAIVFKA
ncbi:MAG: ABC transporter permease [Cyanobacteria bacterium SW_11_48_12]|nr:MAG: ABC transporter permease [Cyanobacteria bacterium SW_11_48_12]